ncbi:MAG TPA: polyprenol phosphomannose-dependent alpha 1,6 mannosyltransferase MptB, partial [Pilimelia sp.]|nr:polyprenol phosphomannose-dependent alpha 1,6 mannosyltransferase MptB [Pilimelia sp.]
VAGAGRRGGRLARAAGAVLGGGVVAFAVLSAGTGLGLGWVAALTGTGQLVQWTSLPTGLGMAGGYLLRAAGAPQAYEEAVLVGRVAGLAALGVILAVLVVGAWRERGPAGAARRCGWAVTAVVLLGPVLYAWYLIVPVALLAAAEPRPGARRLVAVLAVAGAYLALPDGLSLAVLTKLPGALLDVALLATAAWWYLRRRPRPAPVRRRRRPGGPPGRR